MSDYDSPWKEALDVYFEPFVTFFFPVIHAEINWSRGYETLDKELQKVAPDAETGRRFADKLVKVHRTTGQEELILIHVEVQGGKEAEFAERMFIYNCRLSDRYNKMVVSLAILADEQSDWRPASFQRGLWGCTNDFTFPTVKLLDYAARSDELEKNDNPFAVFVLAHLKALETKQNDQSRYTWKIRLIRGLFERGLPARDIRQLLRLIDWVIELPPGLAKQCREEIHKIEEETHMPYVTSFEQMAKEEGLEQGLEQGEKQGEQRGLKQGIQAMLELRFGKDGLSLMKEIDAVTSADDLRTILDRARQVPSLEALRKCWSNNQ